MEMDKDGINQYLFYVHERYKQRTVKRKIASLKAFIGYLEYEEIIEENPFRKINTKFKEEIILPRTIPRDIVEHLLHPVLSCSNNNVNITGVDFGILSFVIISFSGFSIDDNTRPLIGVAESDKSQGDELGVVGIIGGYLFYLVT